MSPGCIPGLYFGCSFVSLIYVLVVGKFLGNLCEIKVSVPGGAVP